MDMYCDWLDAEKTIILLQINRSWSWDDYALMRDTINALAMTVCHPVYYIVDHSPANLQLLGTQSMLMIFNETVANMPSHVTGLYLVGFPRLLKMFFRTLQRISTVPLLQTVTFGCDVASTTALIQQSQRHFARCVSSSSQ
ncbi:MAG: hypothetical protein ACFE0Q_20275 [Anaerolineae bacterium]